MEAPVENEQMVSVENEQMVSVENDQMVGGQNDQMVGGQTEQMVGGQNEQMVGGQNEQMVGVENDQVVSVENEQMASVENDQMACLDNDEIVSVENNQLVSVGNDQMASVDKDQIVSVEKDQMASVENNPLASVENDQLASIENDQIVSVENNQGVTDENDQMASVDNDQNVGFDNDPLVTVEKDQMASVDNDQIVSVENDQLVSVENDEMACVDNDQIVSVENNQGVNVDNDQMTSVDNDQIVGVESDQMSCVEKDQMAGVEKDQLVSVENDQLVSVENDCMACVENDQTVSVENNQGVSVENDQMASVENDQTVGVESDQLVSVDGDQIVSIDGDQLVSVENGQLVSVENGQLVSVENGQLVSVENDQLVSIENDQMACVDNDQIVSAENNEGMSVENDQTVDVESDQMVSLDNNHLAILENDDLANMDTDDVVNMEDDHQQLVNMEDHQQLVNINQLDPFENNLLVPVENNQLELIDYNPLATIENDQLDDVGTATPNKRRKKKSVVWEHFTIETVSAECRRACCNQCKQSFAYSMGSKVAGTSHLKRHIAKGACPVVLRNQIQFNNNDNITPYSAPSKMGGTSNGTDPPKRRYRTAASVPYMGFDPDSCRHEISRMIIMHEYPLHIVEHPGFIAFVKSLQPRFDMLSFDTVQGDCLATYLREKQALQKVIEMIPGRICLTLDMWSSNLTTGYIFLTGSYIDTDWKLHRKLLNVVMEPYPESDSAFSHAVSACLSDWNMEGRLFTLTLNQPLSEGSIDNLRALLSIRNPLMLGGQLLVGNCLAHSISSVAREALMAAEGTVKKVRDSVKYVKTSESREEKFLELKQQLQVPSTKTLAIDDRTRWNTTYEMLISASELKEVFSCLDTSDPDYKEAPSMEIWKQVETLCTFLKLLYETATVLSARTTPTTNTYFHEVWKIQLELVRAVQSEDPFLSCLTKAMKDKFDEYWKSCSLVLAIAVVMDPRFKMKLVEFSFSKIYGDDAATFVKIVSEGIHELYLEYLAQPLPLTPTFMEELNGSVLNNEQEQGGLSNYGLGLTDFDMYIMQSTSQQSRSELDQYLEESLLPRVHEFDVLGWWKINKTKYPTLSKMARDILTVPVCTLRPGLVFDTERRRMDNYRCSLRPETVEALICAKDWLKSLPLDTLNTPMKMDISI